MRPRGRPSGACCRSRSPRLEPEARASRCGGGARVAEAVRQRSARAIRRSCQGVSAGGQNCAPRHPDMDQAVVARTRPPTGLPTRWTPTPSNSRQGETPRAFDGCCAGFEAAAGAAKGHAEGSPANRNPYSLPQAWGETWDGIADRYQKTFARSSGFMRRTRMELLSTFLATPSFRSATTQGRQADREPNRGGDRSDDLRALCRMGSARN